MATDPARAKKRTIQETRLLMQAQCREEPCIPVMRGKHPGCVVCVHEKEVRHG